MPDDTTPHESRTVTEMAVPGLGLTIDAPSDANIGQVVFTAASNGAPPRLTVTYDLGDDRADPLAETAELVRRIDPAAVRAAVDARTQSMADDPYAHALAVVAEMLEAAR